MWCVSVCIPTCHGVLIGQLVGIRFIFYHSGPKDWIQVIGLGSKQLCSLSHHLDRVSRNSYAWLCSLYQPQNPKYTSHLLYHSNTTIGEAGIHGTTLRIQLKDDSKLIHIITVNIDTIPGFITLFGPTQLTMSSRLNPINSSVVCDS